MRRCWPRVPAASRPMRLANRAAGIVVGKFGTAVASRRRSFCSRVYWGRGMSQYIVVTGAAGFIGANLVKALNERGETDIIAVDNLTKADKFMNLADCEIADYLDKDEFLDLVEQGVLDGSVAAIFHQGACSDTMETDGRYMMENNYRYSARCWISARTRVRSSSTPRRPRLRRRAGVFARRARSSRRSTCTATPSSCSTRACAACGANAPRRSWASAISTSTARASSTRGAWPRWRSTSSTSTAPRAG